MESMTSPVYLDYNATTPLDPEVIGAMRSFIEADFGNPSSTHFYGIVPRRALERAREQTAALLNCSPSEIVFTGCATESNNHAIKGAASAMWDKGNHIITTSIEHPAVLEVCAWLEKSGFDVTYLPVDGDGLVDVRSVERAVTDRTVLITVMHANNEVGTIQPIEEIAAMARSRGILMHTDAAQSPGKVPVDVRTLGVDLLTVAGHKLYAPKGVGALYIREGVRIDPFMNGAGQERGQRAGTENVIGIVGLGMACEVAARDLRTAGEHLRKMRDLLHEGIVREIPDARLNGHPLKRLPNTLSLSFRGLDAGRILEEIGLDVAASAGAACHSEGVEISHVLAAMAVPEEWASGTLRLSTGRM
ncbi:MAG TPA: aminotransferase class V-fold PLP-dependent enzyme, partial [Deltaproteobacteria bacterium]|nr:aminotransferase class V-fold PLP-dependent enzyme [Deltaproteobacteria bacterium]